MNKELIELLKQGTHCIEMPDNPTKKDVKLLSEIIGTELVGHCKYYHYLHGGHNSKYIPSIPLSSFIDTPKMISVEAVKEWVDTQSKVYKAIPIDQLLTFLNTHTNVK